MKLDLSLCSPDGQEMPLPGHGYAVKSLSWTRYGGPEAAVIQFKEGMALEAFSPYLGWPLRVYNRYHTPVWWGFIDALHQKEAASLRSLAMDDLANRVAVSYLSQMPNENFGRQALTPWQEDLASQSSFGVKESLIQRGSMGEEEALQLARMVLAQRRLPREKLQAGRLSEPAGLRLYCSGWFKTLSWASFETSCSVIGNSPAQTGTSRLGMESSSVKIAQSFRVETALNISFIALRLRKIGHPLDQFQVQVQSDAAGKPSGAVLGTAVLSPEALSVDTYNWLRLSLGQSLPLEPGQAYWLVLGRTSALNAADGYAAGLDESLQFPGGKALRFNSGAAAWEALVPEAQLLFKVGGLRATDGLMSEIYARCGGMLKGLNIQLASAPQVSSLDDELTDGQAAMERYLRLGSGLLSPLDALVDPERRLLIRPEGELRSIYHYGKDHKLLSERGFEIEEGCSPVGGGFMRGYGSHRIHRASLEVETGEYVLEI